MSKSQRMLKNFIHRLAQPVGQRRWWHRNHSRQWTGLETLEARMLMSVSILPLLSDAYVVTPSVPESATTVGGNQAAVPGSGPAAQLVLAQQPTDAIAGTALATPVEVDVEDANGNLVTTDSSSVTLAIASGPSGATLGGITTVNAVNGIATFSNLLLTTAGTYTLTASDGSLTATSSNSFNVVAGAPTQLSVIQQPTNTVAGAVMAPPVTVAVEDAYGNIVTTDTSTVTLSLPLKVWLAAAQSQLPSPILSSTPLASVAAINGVATFNNLSIDAAGSDELLASDGTLAIATTSNFIVTPGAPTTLVFGLSFENGPIFAYPPGTAFVSIEDAQGNLVTTDNSSVSLTVASGPSIFPVVGGTVIVPAVNGVASFNLLTLPTPGVYTFTASDGALPPATSGPITVPSPAAAAITHNGHSVADGATTTATANGTSFGFVKLGARGAVETFTIANDGGTALTLGTPSLPAGFILVSAPASSVNPDGKTAFTIALPTSALGTFGGDVSIATNDANNNPYNFEITGTITGTPPTPIIRGKGYKVTDGSTTTRKANGTDFGSIREGARPVRETFTIVNTGAAALSVGIPTLPVGFTLVSAPASSVKPGGRTTFTIALTTSTPGSFSGVVALSTNDPNNDPYTFDVAGTVIGPVTDPQASVSQNGHPIPNGEADPSTINGTDFGDIGVTTEPGGVTVEIGAIEYTITNTGTARLTITAPITVPTGFTVSQPLSTTIPPGGSTTFTIFVPSTVGTFSGNVRIPTNDPNNSVYTFDISGTVIQPPPPIIPVGGLTPFNVTLGTGTLSTLTGF